MKKIITALLALMLTTFLTGCEININIPNNNTGSGGANTETQSEAKEPETKNPFSTTTSLETPSLISKEKAKEIALNHAGVANVREFEIELDKEMRRTYFEIDFKAGNLEYSYEIDAKTGAVVKSEREIDD